LLGGDLTGRHNVGVDGVVAIIIFILSLMLLIAAVAGGYESVDLLPTGTGLLYALAAAVAACGAVIVFAIAVLIRRVDRLLKLFPELARPAILSPGFGVTPLAEASPVIAAAPLATETELREIADEGDLVEEESPINFNRSGHLPSLETVETTIDTPEEPQGPPSLIGSYSSAGANYKIFADGSIEAETNEGRYQFASMSDFKRHLAERGTARAPSGE
jgi:hypothetical protein